MDFIVTILMLISFAFIVLGIIGLFKPEKGGFWIKFLKEKKRIKVFGFNILGCVIFFIISGFVIPEDHYRDGVNSLDRNNFTRAVKEFEDMKTTNAQYVNKESLVKDAYSKAETYYTTVIDEAIANLDEVSAIENNNAYHEFCGKYIQEESSIINKIAGNIESIKKEIADSIKTNDFETALSAAKVLQNNESTKVLANDKIAEINNLIFEKDKSDIGALIATKNYSEAMNKLKSLPNNDLYKEFKETTSADILDLTKSQLKEKIVSELKKSNVDNAKSLINELRSIGGEEEFIISQNREITKIENREKIKTVMADVKNLVSNANFSEAKSKVYTLNELGVEYTTIQNTISQINETEEKYREDERKRKEKAYKDSAMVVYYGELLRNPQKYMDKIIRYYGKVTAEVSNNNFVLTTKYDSFMGYYDDDVIFYYAGGGVIPGDTAFVYGKFTGLKDTLLGKQPQLYSEVVDVLIAR